MDKLTPKEKLFCNSYISNGFNGTQSAITAGYSKKTANVMASQILTKLNIKEYIKKQINNILDNREVLQKQWLDNVTEMAFYELTGDSEVDKYRANDKTKALELLGKYLTLFTEKKEVEHTTVDDEGNKTGINIKNITEEQAKEMFHKLKNEV